MPNEAPASLGNERPRIVSGDPMTLAPLPGTSTDTDRLNVIVAPGDPDGYPITHPYVEDLYVPIVGPSTYLLLRLLDRMADEHPDTFTLSLDEIAHRLGLGNKGRSSRMIRTIDRLCSFRLAVRISPDTIVVPRQLPPLTNHQLDRLMPAVAQHDVKYRTRS